MMAQFLSAFSRGAKMQISELQMNGLAEVVALWQRVELTRPWNVPLADAEQALRNESSTILVGHRDGALLASAMGGFDGHRGWLYYVAVRPESQGQGLGQQIVGAATDWLRRRSVPKVQLMVRSENSQVIRFYEQQGYETQDIVVLGKRL
ncbi:GNAT family acetyltransferase [Arthrobacter sp. MYb229]|nr:GNAT family acetyltransferase [Arthrobacter sp. MYb229]PRB50638.1 GNAT family acetyltransferase [Arthrobacter sp. MYb216]